MSIDRPARRVDVVGAQLIALRDRFRRLDPEDRDGAAGDVARLDDLLDQLCVFESEARAQEAVLLEERSAHAIERQQYQELLDLVPVATLMTTPSGVIQQANRAAAALLGVPPGYVIGKPLAAFATERTAPMTVFANLAKLKEATGTLMFDERLRVPKGRAVTAHRR